MVHFGRRVGERERGRYRKFRVVDCAILSSSGVRAVRAQKM